MVIGASDSVSPETLELAILTQRVRVQVPSGVARYDPQVIHRWVKLLISQYIISVYLNCFKTNRVRNRFRAGTVKSLK